MAETIYFEQNGDYWKAEWDYDRFADNPRDTRVQDNLGTMVFLKQNGYGMLGDKVVDDYQQYFIDELMEVKPIETYAHKIFSFKFPNAEDVVNHPFWKSFIAGNSETGIYIDKPLFDQHMESMVSSMLDVDGAEDWDVNIENGIPLDKDMNLTDTYYIEYRTPIDNPFNEQAAKYLDQTISENISAMDRKYDTEIKDIKDDFSESELYEMWKDTKAVVLPIDLVDHSILTCHEASVRKTLHVTNDRDDGFIYNSGLIFVDKDNEEYRTMLDSKGKKAANEWASGILRAEIQEYASYLEDDVHIINTACFDKENLEWTPVDVEGNIYGSSLEENLNAHGYDTSRQISKPVMWEIENTITPEFIKKTASEYTELVRKELPDFDNNVKSAATSVLKQFKAKEDVNREDGDRINRWSLKKEALNQFFAQNGCSDNEKLFDFIAKNVIEKNIEPLGFRQPGVECYYSKNNRSDSSAKGAVHSALLIDHKDKRFAFLNGVEYMVDTPSTTYLDKVTCLSSSKKVEAECEKLVKAGYKNSPVEKQLEDYRFKQDKIDKYIMKDGRGW